MTQDLQKIQAIFEAAADLEGDARDRYLDSACGGDKALRAEIEDLLRLESAGDTRIRGNLRNVSADAMAGTPGRSAIGPYRIIREIGQGGMGTVYLGARDDRDYHREVAIKIVPAVIDRKELLRRFKAEQQVMASLEHSNIASLLDGATTDDGLPYIVMEYVDGVPVDEYCDTHRLGTKARLELFVSICNAVAYAHRNLIVHRDIKPSNILVTGDGEPKLLDFGIAKILAPDDAQYSLALTRSAMRMMTPQYASPEQVRGNAVGTASDVYSLGVLLHKLLTGCLPYDLDTRELGAVERIICEQAPSRPSDAARTATIELPPGQSLQSLQRRLRGDLDDIVVMALRKEPERRYASVDQFADDIRRHLDGLPVIARPDTVSYRFGKFVQRHRIGVSITAAVVVAFSALVTFYTAQLAAERDAATLEARKARRVAESLEEIMQLVGPESAKGPAIPAETLLAAGTERLREKLVDEPEVLADLLSAVGRTYRSMGLYEKALALARESLQLRENVLPPEHVKVGDSHFDIGFAMVELGRFDASQEQFEKSLDVYESYYGREPNVRSAAALRELSFALLRQDDVDAARRNIEQSLEQLRALQPGFDLELAASLNVLYLVQHVAREFDEALATSLSVLEIRRNSLDAIHPDVATALHNVSSAYSEVNDYDREEEYLRKTLAMRTTLFGEDSVKLATTLNALGLLLLRRGQTAEAVEVLDKVRNLFVDNPPYLATTTGNLVNAMTENGQAEDALELGLETFDRIERELDNPSSYRSIFQYHIGLAAREAGNLALARLHLQASADQEIEMDGSAYIRTRLFLEELDALPDDIGSAISAYESALVEIRETGSVSPWDVTKVLFRLAELQERAGHVDNALDYYRQTLAACEDAQVTGTTRYAMALEAVERLAPH